MGNNQKYPEITMSENDFQSFRISSKSFSAGSFGYYSELFRIIQNYPELTRNSQYFIYSIKCCHNNTGIGIAILGCTMLAHDADDDIVTNVSHNTCTICIDHCCLLLYVDSMRGVSGKA